MAESLARQIGLLAKRRREEIGLNRDALAKEASIDEQAIQDFEYGRALPDAGTQRKLENALSWRLGSITDATRMTEPHTLTMEQVDAEDSLYLASQGASIATATDDALLAEVARRGL